MAQREIIGMRQDIVPKISVIMPCHDNGPYVAEAIASVFAQTLPAYELIFVDDACADDSAVIAARFGSRVKMVRGRFGSCGAARNGGIVHASGEYLAFLDADDAWTENSLAARFAAMTAAKAELCFGRVRQTWLDVGEAAKPVGPEMVGRLAGSMLVARAAFDRVGLFDGTLKTSEAIDWAARAADMGVVMTSCPDLVLFRRVHASNTMRITENVNRLPLKALRTIVARRAGAA